MRRPHCTRNGSWLPRPPVSRRPQMSAQVGPAVEGTDVQIKDRQPGPWLDEKDLQSAEQADRPVHPAPGRTAWDRP
jgi:hypothetical protein